VYKYIEKFSTSDSYLGSPRFEYWPRFWHLWFKLYWIYSVT